MASGLGIDTLRKIGEQFEQDKSSVTDRRSLDEIRARYLSRKSGLLTLELRSLGSLPKEVRSNFGKFGNRLKEKIEASIAELETLIWTQARKDMIARETLDVSLPGSVPPIGHRHPITLVRDEMEAIFVSMGYSVEDGPEVESTYYNFEALNIPSGHPARDPSDTFYVSDDVVLRTHTSPVQVRTM